MELNIIFQFHNWPQISQTVEWKFSIAESERTQDNVDGPLRGRRNFGHLESNHLGGRSSKGGTEGRGGAE